MYEHPHARGRGRGERRGNMEICPESERRYLVELEETLREQETQSRGSWRCRAGAERSPGDEDGQDDRVEQERTDAQANPGADVEMSTQAAAARVELAEASGTPLPGGAGGGGGSESDGGEPDPKRRQTMEEVEDEAGIERPAPSREQAREVGSDGIRKTASSSGFLAKRNAKRRLQRRQQQQQRQLRREGEEVRWGKGTRAMPMSMYTGNHLCLKAWDRHHPRARGQRGGRRQQRPAAWGWDAPRPEAAGGGLVRDGDHERE